MSEIDEKTKLEKITKLLEKGGTMLAQHHDCGAPMFRYQGKIMCPACESAGQQERKTEQRQGLEKKGEVSASNQPQDRMIRDNVLNKVIDMSESLDNEQDLQRTRDKFACIEQGIKILRLLENPT